MLILSAATRWFPLLRAQVTFSLTLGSVLLAQAAGSSASTNDVEVLKILGTVEVSRAGSTVWDPASTKPDYRLNPGDQIRTKDHSRATLRLADLTIVELGPNSHFTRLPVSEQKPGFNLLRGLLYLFHRNKPGEFYFRTPTASPVVRGTEFEIEVAEDGGTTLHLLEGQVALTNEFGQLDLKSGESAAAEPGHPPQRRPALDAVNVVQWCLYYPAVLHLPELQLDPEQQTALSDSLAAYQRGDLLTALNGYPESRRPGTDAEKVYLAALLLAVGEVEKSKTILESLNSADKNTRRLLKALQTLIAAVKHTMMPEKDSDAKEGESPSTLLADSYYYQSKFKLGAARDSARKAVQIAPDFGFGWARLAELELSFGATDAALKAVSRSLELAPANAQALTTKGFLFAARNRMTAALEQFEKAIALDGALGNAWLGRGLCLIHNGQRHEGTRNLVVAAAAEPNRALLRSYLGKAFYENGDDRRALRELDLAVRLDPNDPTSWLYSALINQQRNAINDAIHDLEHSKVLNDNRQLYRSRLLLDQDSSVRQANLASIYQDAGLFDQSVREASKAVGSDYANFSAHLFLANSYSQLRDRNLVSLRYETATLSEYLVAQLLAPVGGSALSSYVSQQEYSRLFDRQGFGFSSATEYLSRGDWQQRAVQYGAFANFDYALDIFYASQNGQQPNNDFELFNFSPAARFQISPQDTLFLQVVETRFKSGDLRQHRGPLSSDRSLRVNESQEPNFFAGYHHEWDPGSHTLLLAGRLQDNFRFSIADTYIPTIRRTDSGEIYIRVPDSYSHFSDRQRSEFEAYSAEVQQIWKRGNHMLIAGGRYQDGETDSKIDLANLDPSFGLDYPTNQHAETHLRRGVLYLYDNWEFLDKVWLIGGLTYDWLSFPENIEAPPITDRQSQKDQLSPKAGVIWQPVRDMLLRGAYTRSLGGVSFDNSVRLEPAQVAGFNQAFRSLIPESVEGTAAGAEFETANVDFALRLPTSTYVGVGGELLWCNGDHTGGIFDSHDFDPVLTTSVRQQVSFDEKSLIANVNQLIGRDWALGARYRISKAHLIDHPTGPPASFLDSSFVEASGWLQQLVLLAKFTHPSGFFSEAQALWNNQESHTLDAINSRFVDKDEDFWQFNFFAGYRFFGRRAELLIGGLNLSNKDYRLAPINLHAELARGRTLLVSLKLNF